MDNSLIENLRKILSRVLNLDGNSINDELTRDDIENWDSFNHLVLIAEIERELGICFSISEVEKIRSFKTLREIAAKNQK
jgi:acyl carrier protein